MRLADCEHLDEADQTEEQQTEGSDHGNEPEAESKPKHEAELELEAKVETETDDTSSKHLSLTFLDSPIIFEEPEVKDHLEDQHPHRRRHHDNLVKLFFKSQKLCLSSSFCPNSCMTLVVLHFSEGHV